MNNTPDCRSASRPLLHLPESKWPEADRARFAKAFEQPRDIFDDEAVGARLKPRTKDALRFGYRRWLGWLAANHPDLLAIPPEARATAEMINAFVGHLRPTCSPRTVASQIGKLHDALRAMYPDCGWEWLRNIKTRLERAIPKRGRKPILLTSQRLIDASLTRLDRVDLELAVTASNASRKHLQGLALRYRDGLLAAVATFLPLRRSNLAELALGSTILRGPKVWTVRIAAEKVKNLQSIEGDLSPEISERVDRFLEVYRPMIRGSGTHSGLWASAKGRPATADALYHAFQDEVKAATGLHLSLHDTRRVSATTWAVHDPANAAGAKDLLGDRSDRVFAEHYNVASGIEASRAMASVLERLRDK